MTCSVPTCDRTAVSRGLCQAHYMRWFQTGNVRPDEPLRSWMRTEGRCSIDGCERAHEARGWCQTHYVRWKKTGDPLGLVERKPWRGGTPPVNTRPLVDRFNEKWQADPDGHWIWTASVNKKSGYGNFSVGGRRGRCEAAHVTSYKLHVGPAPKGYHVHHLCGIKRCVNPAHLQLLTASEHHRLHGKA